VEGNRAGFGGQLSYGAPNPGFGNQVGYTNTNNNNGFVSGADNRVGFGGQQSYGAPAPTQGRFGFSEVNQGHGQGGFSTIVAGGNNRGFAGRNGFGKPQSHSCSFQHQVKAFLFALVSNFNSMPFVLLFLTGGTFGISPTAATSVSGGYA
jgi:hypothetical protein